MIEIIVVDLNFSKTRLSVFTSVRDLIIYLWGRDFNEIYIIISGLRDKSFIFDTKKYKSDLGKLEKALRKLLKDEKL